MVRWAGRRAQRSSGPQPDRVSDGARLPVVSSYKHVDSSVCSGCVPFRYGYGSHSGSLASALVGFWFVVAVWRSGGIGLKVRASLYVSLVRSVLVYGVEAMVLSSIALAQLEGAQTSTLRQWAGWKQLGWSTSAAHLRRLTGVPTVDSWLCLTHSVGGVRFCGNRPWWPFGQRWAILNGAGVVLSQATWECPHLRQFQLDCGVLSRSLGEGVVWPTLQREMSMRMGLRLPLRWMAPHQERRHYGKCRDPSEAIPQA